VRFNKPACTYPQQLEILKNRGLVVDDEPFAMHCLEHLNYYRLSAYRFPLAVQGDPDTFLPGTTFDELWALYHFDRTLRRLVLDASKRVEISVRSKWAYLLGHKYGPQAYEDPSLFDDRRAYDKIMQNLDKELQRSREDFVKHFSRKYGMRRPPIWAACEVCSFGQVSHFFKALKAPVDRQAIATCYNLDERILGSFLHHLTVVRNHAAHHGRLWNRKFPLTFVLPRNADFKRLFEAFVLEEFKKNLNLERPAAGC
jgi:abortive infection bacteriophage resistance protein